MASKLYNLCRFLTSTTGTGTTIAVGAAVASYLTPALAGVQNGDVVDLAFLDGANSQIGTATYNSAGPSFTGLSITKSTNSNSPINLSGSAQVFIDARAETLADASGLTAGTLPISRVNGGTANQIAQGDGSFVTNGRKLLNTLTASNSAALQDTTSFTAAFSKYEIWINNLIPATNSITLVLQVHSGGAFQTTGYSGSVLVFFSSALATPATTGVALSSATSVDNTSPGWSGILRIANPSSSVIHEWHGEGGYKSAGNHFGTVCGGFWNTAAAVDGFQIFASSGNLTSGTVDIYGLA